MKQILNNKYTVVRQLGSGAIGRVFLCTFDDQGIQKQVAIKEISQLSQSGSQNAYLQEELKIINHLIQYQQKGKVSDNVMRCYETFQDGEMQYIVSQFCSHGDLHQHISRYYNFYDLNIIISMCIQIIRGIKYLSEVGITHRDLKPENILLNQQDGGYQLVITDFGISSIQNMKSTVGTINYIAPEILQMRPYEKQVDIWSYGCLIYEIMYNQQLFSGQSQIQILRQVRNFKEYYHNEKRSIFFELNQLIGKCLNIDPKKRPSPDQILYELYEIQNMNNIKNKKEIEPINQQEKHDGSHSKNEQNQVNELDAKQDKQERKQSTQISLTLTEHHLSIQQENELYGEQKPYYWLDYIITKFNKNQCTPLSEKDIQLLNNQNKNEIVVTDEILDFGENEKIKGENEDDVSTVIVLLHHILSDRVDENDQIFQLIESGQLNQNEISFLHYYISQCLVEDTDLAKIYTFFQLLRFEIFQQIIKELSKKISSEKIDPYQIDHVKQKVKSYSSTINRGYLNASIQLETIKISIKSFILFLYYTILYVQRRKIKSEYYQRKIEKLMSNFSMNFDKMRNFFWILINFFLLATATIILHLVFLGICITFETICLVIGLLGWIKDLLRWQQKITKQIFNWMSDVKYNINDRIRNYALLLLR